jgi:hypothetical protein
MPRISQSKKLSKGFNALIDIYFHEFALAAFKAQTLERMRSKDAPDEAVEGIKNMMDGISYVLPPIALSVDKKKANKDSKPRQISPDRQCNGVKKGKDGGKCGSFKAFGTEYCRNHQSQNAGPPTPKNS